MKINSLKKSCCAVALSLALFGYGSVLNAAEFSASFKGTDINEFISTVGKNLNKNFETIMMIIDDMFDKNPQFFFEPLFDNLVDYRKITYMDD